MTTATLKSPAKSAQIARRPLPHYIGVVRTALCSLLILFILYGDAFAILAVYPSLNYSPSLKFVEGDKDCSIVIGNVRLSMPKLLYYAFSGASVFSKTPPWNIEFAVYGRHVGADPKQWGDLGFIKNCFPYDCRGEVFTRFDLPWHKLLGTETHDKAVKDLVAKIKNRYNLENPQNPIDTVAVYMVWWPRSDEGFYKLKTPANTHWRCLAEE